MTKTAWVFPGQGSQSLGMGEDLIHIPFAKARFELARELLGWDILEVCLERETDLSQTLYTQPCLYVISTILADLLKSAGYRPSIVSGHSLGEYSALYTAEVFSFEAGLKLVKRRAELMADASEGVMVASIGFNRQLLERQIAKTPDVVLANDNHNSQVVISGTQEGVNTVLANVKVRRSIPLKVSGAFHSPLMAEAAREFDRVLTGITFQSAKVPVISNVEPLPTTEAEILKTRLIKQMTGRVRWREIVDYLAKAGIEKAIEIGPGTVLTNTIRRMYPEMELYNVSSNLHITKKHAPQSESV